MLVRTHSAVALIFNEVHTTAHFSPPALRFSSVELSAGFSTGKIENETIEMKMRADEIHQKAKHRRK